MGYFRAESMRTRRRGKDSIVARTATPLARRHMPVDFSISLDRYTSRGTALETRIPPDFGPRQDMQGFEAKYHNIVDYIVRITHHIWEDRAVDYIGDTYAGDSRVFDDYGLQRGSAKIISDTHKTLAAFSDIRLLADEVIWAGDDDVGFHTSHRVLIRGTNDGDSVYGPATGRSVNVLVIANCVSLQNEIFLEHVLYNSASMAQQLGFDARQTASRFAANPPAGWPRDAGTWAALREAASPEQPISTTDPRSVFDVDEFERSLFASVWINRNSRTLTDWYSPDCTFHGPTDRRYDATDDYAGFLDELFASIAIVSARVDEVYWMGNDAEGFLASTRWSLDAMHRGDVSLGPASDVPIQIWGITQHRIDRGKIVAEWMLFNELDVMMQIEARRHDKQPQE